MSKPKDHGENEQRAARKEPALKKTIEYYLSLPYTIELVPEPEGGWFVGIKELTGCISEGNTPEDALEMIRDAQRGWLEIALEDNIPIPEPQTGEEYSGKFIVRVPRSLHRTLVERAEGEGVSLNRYVSFALARAVGQEKAAAPQAAVAEDVAWPGLKASVRQVLLAAGLADDAGELDEQVFASWASARLAQAADLSSHGDVVSSAACLNSLTAALSAAGRDSPVIAVLRQAVSMLSSQTNADAEDEIEAQAADLADKITRLSQSKAPAARGSLQLTAPNQERIIDGTAWLIATVPQTTMERSFQPKSNPTDTPPSRAPQFHRARADKDQSR